MKIPNAFLADDANVSQEGKLNVLGVFDRVAAPAFPTIHPKMVYVVRVQAEYEDNGQSFPMRVRLIDEDGGVLFEAGGEISPPPVAPGDFAIANQIFTLIGVGFPRPGSYKFVTNVGEVAVHETPLVVAEIPAATA